MATLTMHMDYATSKHATTWMKHAPGWDRSQAKVRCSCIMTFKFWWRNTTATGLLQKHGAFPKWRAWCRRRESQHRRTAFIWKLSSRSFNVEIGQGHIWKHVQKTCSIHKRAKEKPTMPRTRMFIDFFLCSFLCSHTYIKNLQRLADWRQPRIKETASCPQTF